MLTRPATLAPAASGPGPRLLVSLGAWTWPGTDPAGQSIAHILLAHPPGRTSHDTAEAIKARMRHIAASLGGLDAARESIPDLHGHLQVIGDRVLLRFDGARYGLRLPTHPTWTDLLTGSGRAVLLLGLDPLARSAGAARVDTYLDAALAADRLLFGLARTT
ncbi:hypothetical protein QMK19_04355 [Streptomyces sp. H10-C2]|uniref:hypothetical protein n=1 Tax=unclassified Streptomyces TaxID=2593676 RepID=UPI0024B94337|nr:MULTISPECIES: hypothetical protein [unclassified Streptomyces]MDJ0341759.1 hypothetical protein [Streptomyces sp. PH10-H1]MDJ0368933.1 hypothetical protein [Streptomyces sp. H10-C2]